jgi:hypothetical protein
MISLPLRSSWCASELPRLHRDYGASNGGRW